MRLGGLTCAVIAMALGVDGPARACSTCGPVAQRFVMPAGGSTDVPQSLLVVVEYQGGEAMSDLAAMHDVRMRKAGGAEIGLTLYTATSNCRTVVFGKAASLVIEGNTDYELLDRFPSLPCPSAAACAATAPAVIAKFRTGTSAAGPVPVFRGVETQSIAPPQLCTGGGSCCGTYTAVPFTLGWMPATGVPAAAIRYNVYDERGNIVGPYLRGTSIKGAILCSGTPSGPIADFLGKPGGYWVHALGSSGDEDGNGFSQVIPDLCAAVPDAGTSGGDGAAADGSTEAPTDGGKGDARDADGSDPYGPGWKAPIPGRGCHDCAAAGAGSGRTAWLFLAWLLVTRRTAAARARRPRPMSSAGTTAAAGPSPTRPRPTASPAGDSSRPEAAGAPVAAATTASQP